MVELRHKNHKMIRLSTRVRRPRTNYYDFLESYEIIDGGYTHILVLDFKNYDGYKSNRDKKKGTPVGFLLMARGLDYVKSVKDVTDQLEQLAQSSQIYKEIYSRLFKTN